MAAGKNSLSRLQRPIVAGLFEKRTSSIQYVVSDPDTRRCAIVDPVLNFEPNSGTITTTSADRLLQHIEEGRLELQWILDTHPHADHLSAAGYLKTKTGAQTGIGERVRDVQRLWKGIYNLANDFPTDGSQWDKLFADEGKFNIGELEVEVWLTPGHTLASIAYVMGDAAFIHDTLFMPDVGTARADFPGGSPSTLWRSIQRILELPEGTRLFTGHDYPPSGRDVRFESTVIQQRLENIDLRKTKSEEEFIALRRRKDRELPLPDLILHALQVNIRGGRLPDPEKNGRRYLKIPLDAFSDEAPKGEV
ncbi:MAG TPA: MBL fold metallo-hydrolase [Aestuariivirgaceae bacterium]